MTDEEKAEKAICEKCSWKGINGQCFEHGSKTCGKIQTYLAGLAEGRKERNCVNCSNHGKQFEVMKLKKENEELKEKLNKKDCEDCFFYAEGDKCDKGVYYASGTSVCNKFVGR